ncbi:hypothetical protein JW899_05210 [Candidatus Uhrbacteria bacterium]|nr:hypothetical protein [Candidatus Uhrbacteria bacterium]
MKQNAKRILGYLGYLLYVLRHKKLVGELCWREGLYLRALTHDWSKLLPNEFGPYSRYWACGGWTASVNCPETVRRDFREASRRHKRRHWHHAEHWVMSDGKNKERVMDMDRESIIEMICDWESLLLSGARESGARQFYRNKGRDMRLSKKTRETLERLLGEMDLCD